jgi:DNA gyrase subunit A
MFSATMHNYILFFTEKGKCFWLKVYDVPEGAKDSKGRAIQNMLNIDQDDAVRAFINVKNLSDPEYTQGHNVVLCTKNGIIKKMELSDFSRPRQNGIVAITFKDGDNLIDAKLTDGTNEILVAIRSGRAIRFNESAIRAVGRTASGVRAIRLSEDEDDKVVGIVCVDNPQTEILVIAERGYGKRSKIEDYRVTNRSGKGVKTLNITEKTGKLIAIKGVTDNDDLMIITKSGITIRLPISDIRLAGRATQGVKVINLRNNDAIAAVTNVAKSEEIQEEIPGDNQTISENDLTTE